MDIKRKEQNKTDHSSHRKQTVHQSEVVDQPVTQQTTEKKENAVHQPDKKVQSEEEIEAGVKRTLEYANGDESRVYELFERREISFKIFRRVVGEVKYKRYARGRRKQERERQAEIPVFQRSAALQIRWLYHQLNQAKRDERKSVTIDIIESMWGNKTFYLKESNRQPPFSTFNRLIAAFTQDRANNSRILEEFGLPDGYWNEIEEILEDRRKKLEPMSVTVQQDQNQEEVEESDLDYIEQDHTEGAVGGYEAISDDEFVVEDQREGREVDNDGEDDNRSTYGGKDFIRNRPSIYNDDDPYSQFGSSDWKKYNKEAREESREDEWNEQEEDSYGVSTGYDQHSPFVYEAETLPMDPNLRQTVFIGDSNVRRMSTQGFPWSVKILAKTEEKLKKVLNTIPVSPAVRRVVIHESINEILDQRGNVMRSDNEIQQLAKRWEKYIDEALAKFPCAYIYVSLPFARKMCSPINKLGNLLTEIVQKRQKVGYRIDFIKNVFGQSKFADERHLKDKEYRLLVNNFQGKFDENAQL